MRRSAGTPARCLEIEWRELRSRLHEALVVQRHERIEPARARVRTRHGEHVTDGLLMRGSGAIAPRHALEVTIALERGDLGLHVYHNARGSLDAPSEILRHAV